MKKIEQTRINIRNGVIRLMKDTDLLKITVKMIMEESGVSRSTFYRYYDSVEAVVKEIEDEILESLVEINRIALKDPLNKTTCESTFSRLARSSTLKEYSEFIAVIDGPHGDLSYKNRCTQVIKNYLREKIQRNHQVQENMDFYLEFMAAGFYQLINYWVIQRPEVSAEEFEKIQQNTFHAFRMYYGLAEDEK